MTGAACTAPPAANIAAIMPNPASFMSFPRCFDKIVNQLTEMHNPSTSLRVRARADEAIHLSKGK
jgi:hypothetical protein